MATTTPAPDEVLETVDALGPPGTPVTTPEVAESFECTQRTIYNRLKSLVDGGILETKKVGAKGRVWWRPAGIVASANEAFQGEERIRAHPVFDSELVGVIVWDEDVAISDANEAFLEMADLDYGEAHGTSWRELTPEEFYEDSERHVEQVQATGSGVPYEKQYYRADGSRFWGLFESRRVEGVGYVEFVVDVTDRKEAEQELEREAERDAYRVHLADAIRPLTDPVEVQRKAANVLSEELDVDRAHYGEVLADGNRIRVYADYHREGVGSLAGKHHPDDYGEYIAAGFEAGDNVVVDDAGTLSELSEAEREMYEAADIGAWIGVPIHKEGELAAFFTVTESEPRTWTDAEVEMVAETADRTWEAVQRSRAEAERRNSEAALERLNAATQELMDADTAAIGDSVAPLVREVLDVEYVSVWRYDETAGELERDAVDAADGVAPDVGTLPTEDHDRLWGTFVRTRLDVENDLEEVSGDESPWRSHAFVPLGRHGVVCLGSTQVATFDDRMIDLVETTAASVETAWNRADGAEELQRRNEELLRLDRLNTLIRQIDQALVAADTREDIEAAVCGRLADSDLYEFAWIGEHDSGSDVVEPRAWAGVGSGYLEDLTISVEDGSTDRDPIARAIETGELQVVADIATDRGFASWREATLERGARSLVCLPLVYDETVYGVLTVYADRPQSDEDERNHEVLAELGDTIAHTLNARETRATLQTDNVVELTLRLEDADTPLTRLALEAECTVDYQGFVPRPGGQADVFFIARGVTPSAPLTAAEGLLAFEDVRRLSDRVDGSLFRVRVSDPTLAARLTEAGAVVRSISIETGVATAVVDVPHTAAVREFLDRLREWFPTVELRARQSRERPLKTRQTFVAALEDRLTDRQREVLQTAYLSGYFEVPRVSNGQEVTELLGVSQPTFSEHLRAAQRGLCAVLFESDSPALPDPPDGR